MRHIEHRDCQNYKKLVTSENLCWMCSSLVHVYNFVNVTFTALFGSSQGLSPRYVLCGWANLLYFRFRTLPNKRWKTSRVEVYSYKYGHMW